MSGEVQFYLVAIPAVILFGLSKGGFSGLGTLGVPMMSLVASPVRAAAIVLPILLVQDWLSVWAFRRDFSSRNLIILIPSSMLGVGVGWLLAARVSDDAVRLAIGVISAVTSPPTSATARSARAFVRAPSPRIQAHEPASAVRTAPWIGDAATMASPCEASSSMASPPPSMPSIQR